MESFSAPQLGMLDPPGVGARQVVSQVPRQGGGYQGICSDSNFEGTAKNSPHVAIADRRFLDLVAMGLNSVWLKVAAEIGVDDFLAAWRILDAHPPHWHDTRGLRMELRRYKAYIRFQRNRYITALHRRGIPIKEIRKCVDVAFGQQLTEQQLARIGGGRGSGARTGRDEEVKPHEEQERK